MKRFITYLFIGIVLFFLEGCATVKDVQRSTDLIRTDNELARLLNDGRLLEETDKGTELSILGDHAKTQADNLKNSQDRFPDAIAYYRIAATAYWQSWKPDAVENFFNAAERGQKLCTQLDDMAPGRDCLFLQLLIPFAGLESEDKKINPQLLLNQVNFSDKNATVKEIENMTAIYSSLKKSKRLLDHIITIEKDNRIMAHTGMKEYYCRNSKKAISRYRSNWQSFLIRVKQFHLLKPPPEKSLDITNDAGVKLEFKQNKPSICP